MEIGGVFGHHVRRKARACRLAEQHETKKTTGVGYARVSSKDQEKEGFSIPAQESLGREYALANGFRILEEFVAVETAKQSGRPGFAR